MALTCVTCAYQDLTPEQHAATLQLMVPRYRDLTCPTPDDLAAALGVPPDDPAFPARRAALDAQIGAALGTFTAHHAVSALFADTPEGGVVAVAVMRRIRGASAAPLGATIGQPASSLPTHRVLTAFRYPDDLPFAPGTTPESALAEWGRLVVANYAQLRPHLATGTITAAEATFVVRHGLAAMLASVYAYDRAAGSLPAAYLFNTKPRLADIFRDGLGLSVVPLFHAGAEPTALVLDRTKFDAPYFQRWGTVLAALVPPDVSAQGSPAMLRHLVATGFTGWHRLPINLPYLVRCDDRTARAMARLSRRAIQPLHPAEAAAAD